MAINVYPFHGGLKGTIDLPASKSISNRLLIIKALCQHQITITNLSESKDTKIIRQALDEHPSVIDVGQAGAAMRFLTAYYANKPGEWTITGTERMKARPVRILVDALRQLDADIDYLENEGYPPLAIKGKKLTYNFTSLDGSVSSQYITALLLIAPALPNGLTIELKNKIASRPYIDLTLRMMNYFGIEYHWQKNQITIKNQEYSAGSFMVEADWSGASYWYEMAALTPQVDLHIKGLQENSLQGDAEIVNLFRQFGVQSEFTNEGVHLTKGQMQPGERIYPDKGMQSNKNMYPDFFAYDFANNPDLVQTFVPLCVALKIPFKISGTESLKIKETDRIKALQKECAKFGANILETGEGMIEWDGRLQQFSGQPTEQTGHKSSKLSTGQASEQTGHKSSKPSADLTRKQTGHKSSKPSADLTRKQTGHETSAEQASEQTSHKPSAEQASEQTGHKPSKPSSGQAPSHTHKDIQEKPVRIETYDDHRMAMAFAPLSILYKGLIVEAPEVVEKSYPGYWEDLRKVGFEIDETNPG